MLHVLYCVYCIGHLNSGGSLSQQSRHRSYVMFSPVSQVRIRGGFCGDGRFKSYLDCSFDQDCL